MKKSTIKFLLMLIIIFVFQTYLKPIWAQSPLKMSYQAVVRNSSDKLFNNKVVGMKISILKGSESGTAVYTETQKPTTNANGLVTLEIGKGNSIDSFLAIDWAKGPYFIKTETDPSGGTNYTISGISELLSVPYALCARTVEIDKVDDADADPTNEIQTLSISGTSLTLSKGGQTVTLPSSGGGDNWGTQTVVTNATLEGNGTTATPLKIAQQAATSGQVLKWNGSTWAPGNDASGSSGLTLPYSQTVANSDFAFSVTNSLNSAIKGSSSSNSGAGVYGSNSATFGFTNGVIGESNSVSGTGVYGRVSASDGFNTGVFGESASKAGTGVYGYNSSTTGSTFGVKGYTSSSDGWGVVGEAPRFGLKGTGGEVGVYGEASFTYGIGVQGVGERYGIFGQGFYGVYGGSNTYDGFGVYGGSQNVGVKGEASSDTGLGVLGYASSATGTTFGVKGLSASPDGTGVYGYNSSATGASYGVYGHSSSGSGYGVAGEAGHIGVYGHSTGEGAYQIGVGVVGVGEVGVRGIGSTGIYGVTNASSEGYGVSGYASTSSGIGVYGSASATTGDNKGVKGESQSPDGTGVYGINNSDYGATYGVIGFSNSSAGTGIYGANWSTTGYTKGIYGFAYSPLGVGVSGSGQRIGIEGNGGEIGVSGYTDDKNGTGVWGGASKYGIMGVCNSITGYAGYFDGRLSVTGNVGIGTNDPAYRLDVAGSINLNKGTTGGAIYCNGNEALWFNGDCYSWGYGGTWNFFQRKVHIGGSNYNPAYMLYVEGDAAKSTGSSVWIIASDIRLKDIQGNYEKGLKDIVALRPVKFNYKVGNVCNLPSDKNYVGFIAQDVQKVFPEAVSEGKDGYLSLDVNSINVALVNAIKELKAENDELNARLIKLEKLMEAANLK